MLRVIVCVALLTSGCAFDPPPEPLVQTKVVTKVVKEYVKEKGERIACPTDHQIKQAAVAASRATYYNIPPSYNTGTCACAEDPMKNGLPCGHRAATWVLCKPEQVPPTLVSEIREKLPPECRG